MTDAQSSPLPPRPGMYGTDGAAISTGKTAGAALYGAGGGNGGDNPIASGSWKSDDWARLVHFDGKGLDYFVLLLQNLLLSILTLGIYSFWGKVNIRKFLWKSTSLLGEPLEYTGTGKELFLGFLIVMPIFIVMTVAASFAFQSFPIVGELVWMLLFIYLWQYASYRALRYRLTRTRWRGIRCNMAGNASSYAWKAALYILLMVVSLGLLAPFSLSRMLSLKLNNVYFGTRKLDFEGTPASLYRAVMGPFAGLTLFGFVLLGGMIAYVFLSSIVINYGDIEDQYYYYLGEGAYYHYYHTLEKMMPLLILFVFLGLLLFSCYFQAAMVRWLFRHTLFGDLQTRSTLSGATLLFTYLTNALLIIFTLGIGAAWAQMRVYRATLNTIDYVGDPELADLLQDTIAAPRYGEGLLEALDVDVAF